MIEPETELVHVPLHVLDRYVVEDAVHSALQHRPEALYAVGVYAVSERVCDGMVYLEPDEVALVLPVEDVVSGELVGHHRRVRLAYLFEYGEQLLSAQPLALVVVVCDNGVYLSRIAFLYAYYWRLGRSTTSLRLVLVILVAIVMLVFLARLSADIGLVYLHNRFKGLLVFLVLHRLADLVQHTPRRSVGTHARFPLQLLGGNVLAGDVHEVDGIEPHPQVKVRVLEDCAFQCGELALAVVAVELPPVVVLMIYPFVYASALGADVAVLVLCIDDEVNRGVLVGKPFCKLKIVHYLCLVFDYDANIQTNFELYKP